MRYRIYFEDETGVENDHICEVETCRGSKPITPDCGKILRVCDDHGRVVSGKPWPKREKYISPLDVTREPAYHA